HMLADDELLLVLAGQLARLERDDVALYLAPEELVTVPISRAADREEPPEHADALFLRVAGDVRVDIDLWPFAGEISSREEPVDDGLLRSRRERRELGGPVDAAAAVPNDTRDRAPVAVVVAEGATEADAHRVRLRERRPRDRCLEDGSTL